MERIVPTGKAMILAYDQGFEHGPRDFLGNPESRKLERPGKVKRMELPEREYFPNAGFTIISASKSVAASGSAEKN